MIQTIIQWLMPQSQALMAIVPIIAAAAIGAIASGVSSLFGARSARRQRQQQLAEIARQQQNNNNWYNRRYNEDATNRADAQRMLTRVSNLMTDTTRSANARKAVIGGTDASTAAAQQANASALGNALADITTNAENRKDDIESQYQQRDNQLGSAAVDVNAQYETARRNNTAQAVSGLLNTAGTVVSAMSGDTPTAKNNTSSQLGADSIKAYKDYGRSVLNNASQTLKSAGISTPAPTASLQLSDPLSDPARASRLWTQYLQRSKWTV